MELKLHAFVTNNQKTLILLAKVAVSLLFLIYLFSKLDIGQISTLSPVLFVYWLACVCVVLVFALFVSYRWKLVLSFFNRAAMVKDLYRFYLIASFFNKFLPGAIGGDVTRIYNSHKKYNLGIKNATIIVFLERMAGLAGLALLFASGLLFYFFVNRGESLLFQNEQYLIIYFLIILAVLLVFLKKLTEKKIQVGYKVLIIVILLSMLGQSAEVTVAYLYAQYFGLPVELYKFMIIMPVIYIATVIPISLGGLGVREASMTALLALFGVETSTAVLIAFLIYFTKVGVGVIGWVVYLKSGYSLPKDGGLVGQGAGEIKDLLKGLWAKNERS